jgi:hypothetical protein
MKESKLPILKIGDYVKIKKGVKDPALGKFDMGGWQGRIIEIFDDDDNIDDMYDEEDEEMNLDCENCKERDTCEIFNKDNTEIDIELDSITLKQLPEEYIKACFDDNDDFGMLSMATTKIEKAKARDTVEETKTTRLGMNLLFNYVSGLDKDHDTMFCVTQSGFKMEENGMRVTDIPYFVQSLLEETRDELRNYLIEEKNGKSKLKIEKEKLEKLKAWKSRKGGLIPIEEFVENIPMHRNLSRLLINLVKVEAAYFVNDITKKHFMRYIGGGPVRWEQLMRIIHNGLKGTKYEKLQGKLEKHFAEPKKKK